MYIQRQVKNLKKGDKIIRDPYRSISTRVTVLKVPKLKLGDTSITVTYDPHLLKNVYQETTFHPEDLVYVEVTNYKIIEE